MTDPAPERSPDRAGPPPVAEIPSAQTGPRPFSMVVTDILTVLMLATFIYGNWAYLTRPRLSLLDFPTTPLFLLHEDMIFHEAAQKLPRACKIFLVITGGSIDYGPRECEVMLRDSIAYAESQSDTNVVNELRTHLAVLLAETGVLSNAVRELNRLPTDEPTTHFRRAFHLYYQTNALQLTLPSEDNSETNLLSGWANRRFTARWLKASGKISELNQHEADSASFGRKMLTRSLAAAASGWLLHVVGVVFLILLWRKKLVASLHCGAPPLPWSAREYWGLFVRGYLFGLVVQYAAIFVPVFGSAAWVGHALVFSLPVIGLLAGRHWLRNPVSFRQFFGIPDTLERAVRLVVAAIALFGVCWFSMLSIDVISRMVGATYWADSVDEVLLWWTWPMRVIRIADGVVFGPFIEEVVFRGLLFGALRSRFAVGPAAGISAAVFGLTHFYSLPGFLGVTAFGFFSALGREKTGSLIPSIIAHMLFNFFIIGGNAFAGF